LSPPPLSPHPSQGRAAAAKECSFPLPVRGSLHPVRSSKRLRSAGVLLGPGARPERPSIRVKPLGPMHLVPYTLRASGTPPARAHPSNERCLFRSPGGRTAALTDLAWFTSDGYRHACVTSCVLASSAT